MGTMNLLCPWYDYIIEACFNPFPLWPAAISPKGATLAVFPRLCYRQSRPLGGDVTQ